MSEEPVELARAAAQFIRRFGEDAPLKTTRLAIDAQCEGDKDLCTAWMAITMKIQELQRRKRRKGERLN
jgi:hypothetical protein